MGKETQITISREDIYHKIYERIRDTIEIVLRMTEREGDLFDESGKEIDRYILLSGLSSKIPIVKEMFINYKNGKRPEWEKEKKKLVYVEAKNKNTSYSKLKFTEIIESNRPKACVVEGAAHYYRTTLPNQPINYVVKGVMKINYSRFGLITTTNKVSFSEWITKYRQLTPSDNHILSDQKDFDKYAVKENNFTFYFQENSKGPSFLEFPIEVYEHLGLGDDFNETVCERAGQFNLEKPPDCPLTVDGILRMEITEKMELKVRAKIKGAWYDAFEE